MQDRAWIALLENAQHGFAGAGVHLLHHRGQLLLRARQVDALRAAEARRHRLLGFLDDLRAHLRDRRSASASPARPPSCAQPGMISDAEARLAGQVRIRIGGGVVAAPGRLRHRREHRAGGALLAARALSCA